MIGTEEDLVWWSIQNQLLGMETENHKKSCWASKKAETHEEAQWYTR